MKTGLRTQLNNLIKQQGYLTLTQVYKWAEDNGHKQKTAERVLNPSLSPDIITIKNASGQITGYRWKENHFMEQWNKDFPAKQPEPLVPNGAMF